MIIYKMIGSASIIFSAIILYSELQKYEKLKLKQINSYIKLIEYIKNQIECFLLPIDAIIHNCSDELIEDCGIKMNHTRAINLEDLIMSAVFYCDSDTKELMIQFAHDFGQGYMEEQISYCDYYRNELIKQRDKIKDKSIKEKKLRLALCICGSFLLILLLI